MLLLLIAFAAGLITAFTPCILPVLPILLAGGSAGGSPRRPYAIVAGLVTTFTLFTVAAAWIFNTLGLSSKWQTRVAVAMLLILAATLAIPRVGEWLERPLLFLTRRRTGDLGGGFLLGASLGLVFVPCAGPVFGAVSTNVGSHEVGFYTVVVAAVYALGAAVPMLIVAAGGRKAAMRLRTFAQPFRIAMAVVMAVAAITLLGSAEGWRGFGWETRLQASVPGYASSLQDWIEGNGTAKRRLDALSGRADKPTVAAEHSSLQDFGPAPAFQKISQWINTPGEMPLTIAGLRGKVVLLDFWTYSCINCLRTLPHLKAWDRAYRKDGLTIVGMHTPEFEFEHVVANVRKAARDLGVRYPVAIDNDYGTWNAYGNRYWPAEYLIDRNGHVRSYKPGEGDYDKTERDIRTLLAEGGSKPTNELMAMPNTAPQELVTPESYLGSERLDRYRGPVKIQSGKTAQYRFPAALQQDELAYAGAWRVEGERAVAVRDARLRLHFHAKHVYLVLGGNGSVHVLVNGKAVKTARITGITRLYTLLSYPEVKDAQLELRFSPGVAGYAFTFG